MGPWRVRGNYGVDALDTPFPPAAPLWALSAHRYRIFSEPENSHVIGLRQRFGHSRQDTEPFVDDGENEAETVGGNPVPPVFPLRSPLQPPHSVQRQDAVEHGTQLEKREKARRAWIQDEAGNMTRLTKLRHELELRFHATHSPDDYGNWQRIETALAATTNLNRVQKERRGLFVKEKGMVPLMTRSVEDMSVANRSAEADGHGEGRLLGFKMGLMERVCAEVMSEGKDGDETPVMAEMLDTLSLGRRRR